ncbi:MAG: hypothetical protein ACE5IO_06175 [Thermoplasmata archaeon]
MNDLERWLEKPRSVGLTLFVPVVIAAAYLISVWAFALLLLPFVFSLYKGYKRSRPITEMPIHVC